MTRWLAAARQAQQAGTQLTQPTKPPPKEVSSVMSVVSEGVRTTALELRSVPEINAPPPETIATSATQAERTPLNVASVATSPAQSRESEVFRHGVSVAGHPLTWTGRVVSLEEWRGLSEWEKHGPRSRLWNGITKQCKKPK